MIILFVDFVCKNTVFPLFFVLLHTDILTKGDMKILQSSFFRALVAIVVGTLLILYPQNTVTGITVAIGVLFLLSGMVSVLTYWYALRHQTDYKVYDAEGRLVAGQAPMFPVVGIGSILMGSILALMPTTFVSALMYVIGVVLVLGAVGQFMSIIAARRYGKVALTYWICPSLILLGGLYVMIKPLAPLSTAMLILGWIMLFYGLVEAINTLLFYLARRRWEKMQSEIAAAPSVTDAEATEVTADEEGKADEENPFVNMPHNTGL
jgi:uncharacterized membrane protein HdeD (DUF308 family)